MGILGSWDGFNLQVRLRKAEKCILRETSLNRFIRRYWRLEPI
jgi:hypothetical protein